jgi:hypothetical protein
MLFCYHVAGDCFLVDIDSTEGLYHLKQLILEKERNRPDGLHASGSVVYKVR